MSNAGGCNHIYNFNTVPRFNHTLPSSLLVYKGLSWRAWKAKGDKTLSEAFSKFLSIAHIDLCYVVAITLFAIIAAERHQVKRVVRVAVLRSKSANNGDCLIVYTKHYRRAALRADQMTDRWNPVDYHEHSYPQYAFALGLLDRLWLNGDERILDVGCGDGRVTAELATRVPHGSVLGIDASPDMIAFARTMYPASAHPNLSFRDGDAAKLTFRHEFDVVVAFASLHWVKDVPAALRGIKQSLALGGRFAAQLVAKRHATAEIKSPLHRARKEVMDRPAWRTYFEGFEQRRAYSVAECERLIRDAGFVLQRCEFVTEEVMHRDADALKGYARSTWHRYTDRIPAQKRDTLLNEVVRRCIELSPADRSGRIHVRASMLEVEATVAGTSYV